MSRFTDGLVALDRWASRGPRRLRIWWPVFGRATLPVAIYGSVMGSAAARAANELREGLRDARTEWAETKQEADVEYRRRLHCMARGEDPTPNAKTGPERGR